MNSLYNCRHSGDQYRITKFSADDMNVQSSYICTLTECQCPAGVRPSCRHRDMLPKFLKREHVGDEWMFDFDRGGWVQMGMEWAKPEAEALVEFSKENPSATIGDAVAQSVITMEEALLIGKQEFAKTLHTT